MELSPLVIVGGCALAVLVLGWLVVSFSEPGPRRVVIEWLSTTAMYTVLLMLFVRLVLSALEAENHFALAAFGFLCALFGGGLLVSLYHTIVATRGAGSSGTSATN